jgi:hypothetical protein
MHFVSKTQVSTSGPQFEFVYMLGKDSVVLRSSFCFSLLILRISLFSSLLATFLGGTCHFWVILAESQNCLGGEDIELKR